MYRNLVVLGMLCVGCKLFACDRWPPHDYNECEQARRERKLIEFGDNRVDKCDLDDTLKTECTFIDDRNYPDLLQYFFSEKSVPGWD